MVEDSAPVKVQVEPEYTSTGKRKRKAPSGPEDWKLRGCARPWESLNDGTLDPDGRPYDVRPEGVDFFATATGRFWKRCLQEARLL